MVKWNRIEDISAVKVHTVVVDALDILDMHWQFNERTGKSTAIVPVESDVPIEVDVSIVLNTSGRCWYPVVLKGTESDKKALYDYIRAIHRLSDISPVIVVDRVSKGDETFTLRQKTMPKAPEILFEDIFSSVRDVVKDTKALVIGTNDRNLAEIQLLFGEDIKVDKSTEKGDIINHGVFLHMNGDIRVSYGINRLACTNGMVHTTFPFSRSIPDSLHSMYVDGIRSLVDWFCNLPDRKVESVRELSVLLKDFPTRMLNTYWKTWSECISLGTLTYYDVVNDIIFYAKNALGGTRDMCISIPHYFKRLDDHKCCTCSAPVK